MQYVFHEAELVKFKELLFILRLFLEFVMLKYLLLWNDANSGFGLLTVLPQKKFISPQVWES